MSPAWTVLILAGLLVATCLLYLGVLAVYSAIIAKRAAEISGEAEDWSIWNIGSDQ